MLRNRLLIALLLAATLVSQAYAQQHIHAEDDTASCLVCAHADNTPAADTHPTSFTLASPRVQQRVAPATGFNPLSNPTYRVRGPPSLQQH